jgi:N-acetylglutamate synthase-like GNAT family acetyltransferase
MPSLTLRAAVAADAPQLHALIASHLEEGRLLPRALGELAIHAPRFVVAVETSAAGDRIVGCAELAPLSSSVAEVRSLVVGRKARRKGLGLRMVDELGRRARRDGFSRICAFAHDPTFFMRLGFSIVPHTWVPEKIARDCHSCALFRNCGQYAVVLDLHARSSVRTFAGTSVGTLVGTSVGTPVSSRV